MSPRRKLWLVTLAALTGWWIPVAAQPPAPSKSPPAAPASPAAPPARTAADNLLDQAVDHLSRLRWIETTIRQETRFLGIPLNVSGKYIVWAPQPMARTRSVYYESEAHIAGARGRIRFISDGRSVWRVEEIGKQKVIRKFEFDHLDQISPFWVVGALLMGTARGTTPTAALPEVARLMGPHMEGDPRDWYIQEAIATEFGFAGFRPILQDLQKRMTFDKLEAVFLPGNGGLPLPVHRLEGTWTKATLEKFLRGPKGEDLSEAWEKRQQYLFIPRKCVLYLGRDSWWFGAAPLWPYRLEWYGPTRPGGPDEFLAAIEFRDPRLEVPPDAKDRFTIRLSEEEKQKTQTIRMSELIRTRREQELLQAPGTQP